jgi:hypothetical protein
MPRVERFTSSRRLNFSIRNEGDDPNNIHQDWLQRLDDLAQRCAGLVEDVVKRTRNPLVIETIARVRILHTGFANRGVPLACLQSPVNLPITTLRKFIHVKFISKADLKRMAMDRTGIRKEVSREVKKYLQTLT